MILYIKQDVCFDQMVMHGRFTQGNSIPLTQLMYINTFVNPIWRILLQSIILITIIAAAVVMTVAVVVTVTVAVVIIIIIIITTTTSTQVMDDT